MATDTPAQNFRLLRKFIPSSLQPYLRGLRKRLQTSERPTQEPFRTVFPYTQVHRFRQENLLRIAREIDDRAIPGAIVECGVLDGGTAAIMAFGTKRSDRPLHLFDSWEGLPAATEKDGDAEMWAGDVVGSPRRVAAVLRALQISFSRVNFHKGWLTRHFQKQISTR